MTTCTDASASGGVNNSTGGRNADTYDAATPGKAKMTSPYCWICQSPAAVHVQGSSYVCADHAEGVGGHYLEGSDTND